MSIYERFRALGAAVLVLVVAFILFQVSVTGLLERRREIGVMQTVGWAQKDISRQITLEAVFSAILGCALGLAISLIVVRAIGSVQVQTSMPGVLSNDLSSLTALLTVSIPTAVGFSTLALIMSVVVSLFVAKRISGMKPLVNVRS